MKKLSFILLTGIVFSSFSSFAAQQCIHGYPHSTTQSVKECNQGTKHDPKHDVKK